MAVVVPSTVSAPVAMESSPPMPETKKPPQKRARKETKDVVASTTAATTDGSAVPTTTGTPTEEVAWLVVAKSVKTLLKNQEPSMHCGHDALPAINEAIKDVILNAVKRAVGNGRKTLKACDI